MGFDSGFKGLSTVVNCNVLNLLSVAFSTMLFVYVISSLMLSHVLLPLDRPFGERRIEELVCLLYEPYRTPERRGEKKILRFSANPVVHIITTSL